MGKNSGNPGESDEDPADVLRWDPSCHHNQDLLALGERFLKEDSPQPVLMAVWGHSWDFDRDRNWGLMEDFCRLAGGKDEVWYATALEIADYIVAMRRLRFSVARDRVTNPSSRPVWIEVDTRPVMIAPAQTLHLETDPRSWRLVATAWAAAERSSGLSGPGV